MLLSSLCVFCPEMLTSKMISSCFTTCLYNRYLEDHLHCLFMLSPVTRYRSVTHVKSDVTVPSSHPSRLFLFLSSSLGDCGVVVCFCGSVIQLCDSSLRQPSSCAFQAASPLRCYTMTSCVSVRCGAVWWETSAPLLLQNPLITWFYLCVGLFISKEGGKKGHKHTNSVQMTTKEMQLQETHSPPALH